MSEERTFPMALRTGNWGRSVMLPFHKPVTITLAPEDDADVVVRFSPGFTAVPRDLFAADLDRVTVAEPNGRAVLHVDRRAATVERSAADPGAAHDWELRLEGPHGVLHFYSREDAMPSAGTLTALADRLRVTASVE